MWSENRVRIVDIADELGLSTATVSNVIHGKTKKISAGTIEAVQRKLQERGYIPNMAATLLAQNDSHIIGVVMKNHEKYEGHALEDPFIASSLNHLTTEIDRAGYFMMLKQTSNIHDIVRFASMWNMDGMILLCFCEDEYQQLRNAIRIPFVVYDGFFENQGRICNLAIDDFDGGRQVGRHFRELGHENALCVADNRACMDWKRYEGFCAGFGAEADLWQIPMQKEARHAYYLSRFQRLKSYTAIFAMSDYYAVDLMQFLIMNGVKVPKEISIAGFDGNPVCEQVTPTLTSVYQDGRRRAAIAVELLGQMKNDLNYTRDILLPVRLVPRDSTARCGKKNF